MQTEPMLAALGPEILWVVLAFGFVFIVALAISVVDVRRRALPAAVLAAGPGLGALAIVVLGRLALSGWPDRDGQALVQAVSTFGAVHLVGAMAMVPLCAMAWSPLAWVSMRSADGPIARGRGPVAAAGALLVATTVGLTVVGGVLESNMVYAVVRGVVYASLGSLAVVALLGGRSEAGAGASVGFTLLVAVGEASERALAQALMVQQTTIVPPEKWPAAVDAMLDAVSGELWWSRGALLVASLLGLLGGGLAWRGRHGGMGAFGVAVWVALAWVTLTLADLGPSRLYDLVAACAEGP